MTEPAEKPQEAFEVEDGLGWLETVYDRYKPLGWGPWSELSPYLKKYLQHLFEKEERMALKKWRDLYFKGEITFLEFYAQIGGAVEDPDARTLAAFKAKHITPYESYQREDPHAEPC